MNSIPNNISVAASLQIELETLAYSVIRTISLNDTETPRALSTEESLCHYIAQYALDTLACTDSVTKEKALRLCERSVSFLSAVKALPISTCLNATVSEKVNAIFLMARAIIIGKEEATDLSKALCFVKELLVIAKKPQPVLIESAPKKLQKKNSETIGSESLEQLLSRKAHIDRILELMEEVHIEQHIQNEEQLKQNIFELYSFYDKYEAAELILIGKLLGASGELFWGCCQESLKMLAAKTLKKIKILNPQIMIDQTSDCIDSEDDLELTPKVCFEYINEEVHDYLNNQTDAQKSQVNAVFDILKELYLRDAQQTGKELPVIELINTLVSLNGNEFIEEWHKSSAALEKIASTSTSPHSDLSNRPGVAILLANVRTYLTLADKLQESSQANTAKSKACRNCMKTHLKILINLNPKKEVMQHLLPILKEQDSTFWNSFKKLLKNLEDIELVFPTFEALIPEELWPPVVSTDESVCDLTALHPQISSQDHLETIQCSINAILETFYGYDGEMTNENQEVLEMMLDSTLEVFDTLNPAEAQLLKELSVARTRDGFWANANLQMGILKSKISKLQRKNRSSNGNDLHNTLAKHDKPSKEDPSAKRVKKNKHYEWEDTIDD